MHANVKLDSVYVCPMQDEEILFPFVSMNSGLVCRLFEEEERVQPFLLFKVIKCLCKNGYFNLIHANEDVLHIFRRRSRIQ